MCILSVTPYRTIPEKCSDPPSQTRCHHCCCGFSVRAVCPCVCRATSCVDRYANDGESAHTDPASWRNVDCFTSSDGDSHMETVRKRSNCVIIAKRHLFRSSPKQAAFSLYYYNSDQRQDVLLQILVCLFRTVGERSAAGTVTNTHELQNHLDTWDPFKKYRRSTSDRRNTSTVLSHA